MIGDLRRAAKKLREYRAGGVGLETEFVTALNEACGYGTAKTLASVIGISEQYLSDVRRGRRPVSDSILNSITGRKANA